MALTEDQISADLRAFHDSRRSAIVRAVADSPNPQAVQASIASWRAANTIRSRLRVPFGGSGDQHADAYSRRLLRELSRDLSRNADTFRVVMRQFAHYLVGSGVFVRATTSDRKWNRLATDHMRKVYLSRNVDARKMATVPALQRLMVESVATDGDAAVIKINGGQLQLIESDQIGGTLAGVTATAGATPDQAYMVGGVQMQPNATVPGVTIAGGADGMSLGPAGDPLEYWIGPYGYAGAVGQRVPFKAEVIEYVVNRNRNSQTRGVPLLVASLDDWERMDSYRESEIIAAEQGACVYGAIECIPGDEGVMPDGFATTTPSGGEDSIGSGITKGSFGDDIRLTKVGAGSLFVLPNGRKYTPINPSRPNRDASPFMIELTRQFCSCTGIPYEVIYNDLRGLSWSTNRALVSLARDSIADWQTDWLSAAFSGIYRFLLLTEINAGRLPGAPEDWDSHEHEWPVIPWPDEGKEYEAQAMGLENNLTSPQRILGNDWIKVMEEQAEAYEFACELCERIKSRFPDYEVQPTFFLRPKAGVMLAEGKDKSDLTTNEEMGNSDSSQKPAKSKAGDA